MNQWKSMFCSEAVNQATAHQHLKTCRRYATCQWGIKGAFTFESATYCCQHFSYLVSVVDIMFVTILVVLDLHSWFVSNMYKTKMTAALSHKFYVNFCFFKFDLSFIARFILRNRDIFQYFFLIWKKFNKIFF